MSNRDKLFELWFEGKLSKEESADFEAKLAQDDELSERFETAQNMYHQSTCFEELDVPDWDRGAAFETKSTPWWQWQWMPAVSMGFSLFALSLVVFKVDLQFKDDGLMISFANSQNQTRQVEALVDAKLKEFAGEQQVVLANYMTDLTQNQQEVNMQLAGYVLEATRKERKQDISDFAQYINDMRSEDNLNKNIRFQRLENKISANSPGLINTNFRNTKDTRGVEK